ncbi:MAG: hypothetical protein LBS05_10740 [Tannerellaceae bacterium]|jgi:hypothetical protein|nr:hypothetical protein [Tannerellaceae bacterium]
MEGEKKKKKRKQRRLSFLYILGGGLLKEDFFVKHIRTVVLIAILTLCFIGNRHACLLKIRKIDTLKQELRDVQLESLSISVELARYSRPSMVEELIKKQQIDLERATTPPYELYR